MSEKTRENCEIILEGLSEELLNWAIEEAKKVGYYSDYNVCRKPDSAVITFDAGQEYIGYWVSAGNTPVEDWKTLRLPEDKNKFLECIGAEVEEVKPKAGEIWTITTQNPFKYDNIIVRVKDPLVIQRSGIDTYSLLSLRGNFLTSTIGFHGGDKLSLATPEQVEMLEDKERENGYFWNGEELVGLPRYVELLPGWSCENEHVGEIFDTNIPFDESYFELGHGYTWKLLLTNVNHRKHWKAVTKEEYDKQESSKLPKYVEVVDKGKSYTTHPELEWCSNYHYNVEVDNGTICKVVDRIPLNGIQAYLLEYRNMIYCVDVNGTDVATKEAYDAQFKELEPEIDYKEAFLRMEKVAEDWKEMYEKEVKINNKVISNCRSLGEDLDHANRLLGVANSELDKIKTSINVLKNC